MNLFEDTLTQKRSSHENYQICILRRLCFLLLRPAFRRKLTSNGAKLLLWQMQCQILYLPHRLLVLPHLLARNEIKIPTQAANTCLQKKDAKATAKAKRRHPSQ